MAVIKDKAWLESLCRSYTEANVRTLGGWANGPETDDDLKMRAIAMLFDRGWGKPKQDNNHTKSAAKFASCCARCSRTKTNDKFGT